jgi:uncharacterized membrane protein YdjX (TVP38/TMEM64 family)
MLLALIIVFLVAAMHYYHLGNYLTIEGFNHYRNQIVAYKGLHPKLLVASYILTYIVLITCCLPGTVVFDILAGFLFGWCLGTILVVFSYSSGAVLNFLLVRYIFKDMLHNRFNRFKKLIQGDGKHSLLINLISLRLIPVFPFWALNIAAVLLKVNLSTFLISTLIGIIPASVIYVLIGEGIHETVKDHQELSAQMLTEPKIWLPLFLLVIILMLPNLIKARKNKLSQGERKDEG